MAIPSYTYTTAIKTKCAYHTTGVLYDTVGMLITLTAYSPKCQCYTDHIFTL